MRRRVVPLLLAAVCVPGRAHAGGATVGLVVFHGPAVASAPTEVARERATARARDARLAWLDLSPTVPVASDLAARLHDGVDAYEELRWDDALEALDHAASDAWSTGGEDLTASDLSDVFLYRGLVQTQRGDSVRAWDDLVRAATLAPARTLDPVRFPTRAVEAFERARAAVAALPRAQLTVTAPGCAVAIDGGASERAEVAHGEHAVRVVCPGQAPWGERVVVAGDVTVAPPPPPAPPDDAALAQLARARAVAALVAVIVAGDGDAATATVEVVGAGGGVGQTSTVTLDDGGAALDAALDAALAADDTTKPPRPRRWWQSPWLWAAGGVAVTAAVLIPFAVVGGDSGTAELRPVWTW